MVSHRLSCIQIQSYKALDRRWFHIGCQAYRYNLIRLYTEVSHGFKLTNIIIGCTEDGFTYSIQSYKALYRRLFHIGCHAYRYNLIRL